MNSSPTPRKLKHIGLDVHAETIAVAIADASGDLRSYGNIPAHAHALDKLCGRFADDGSEIRYIYEAGPTGFALCRHLHSRKTVCEVLSPSQIPKCPSDRVNTDRRYGLGLARLFRAGEPTLIHIPDEADEAIRDLVRCRLAAVAVVCASRVTSSAITSGTRVSRPGRLNTSIISAAPSFRSRHSRSPSRNCSMPSRIR